MIYQCPVETFGGEVEIDDFLNYRQLASYERGMIAAKRLMEASPDAGVAEIRVHTLPGVLSCVKAFRLRNVSERPTLEDFPSTPRKEAGELYLWLLEIVREKIESEDAAPK